MNADKTPVPKSLRLKKWHILALVILAAIIVALGVWLRETNKPTATKLETKNALQEAVSGDEQETISRLTVAYNNAATDEGKADAAYFLAARHSSAGNHDNALRYFREADKLGDGKNIDIILGVANSAEQTGNKKIAIEYYQKAIDHYKSLAEADSSLQSLIVRFEAKVSDLQ